MVKIAVASTDGKLVNQHFGRADAFYILETDEETAEFTPIEKRAVVPVCERGDHEDDRLRQNISSLSDCRYVLVSRVGMRARQEAEAMGIEIFEIPGIIGESVDKLIKYIKVQNLFSI
jgi:predicted Fe-Mo cluster-binding NifX family protein